MRFLFCFILFFSTISLYGQEMYWGTPAKLITEFHFKQLNGGVILLKARFNNIADTFNFILDTGSGGISLDSTTTAKYSIAHKPSGRYIYGIAGVRKVDFSQHNSLSFPGLKVDSLDFYINDYDVLTSVYGVKIDGIIGYSFLQRFMIKINFDSLMVSIYHPGYMRYPSHGILLHPDFRGLPIVPITIKDSRTVTTNYFFDTGAGLCFLLSKQLKDDSSILIKRRKPVVIEVQGLGGVGDREPQHQRAQQFRLAGTRGAHAQAVRAHALLGRLLDVELDDIPGRAHAERDPQPLPVGLAPPVDPRVDVGRVAHAEQVG